MRSARAGSPSAGGLIATVVGNGNLTNAGDGGLSTNASLYDPSGVALDSAGNLYVADYCGNRIRKVTVQAIATTATEAIEAIAIAADGAPSAVASVTYGITTPTTKGSK